jgi:NAD(P)-dependent dehydrogenase (short-subunit alcohol dehydrogenase family)
MTSVVLTSGWDPAIRAAADQLAQQGARVLCLDSDDRAAVGAFGAFDVLVHGPARYTGGGSVCDAAATAGDLQHAIEAWSADVELVARHASPERRCRVVTVVSGIGRYRSGYFVPESRGGSHGMDAARNSALLGLTRQRSVELAPHVALNAVAMGWIGAPDVSPTGEVFTEEEWRFLTEEIALRRPGTPQEVAAVIVFLASEASSYLTGEVIDVNGGWWMS